MLFIKWTFLGLILLPMAEMVAFILVVLLIGWFWTILLAVSTSITGIVILNRNGRSHIERFRTAWSQEGLRAINLNTPGVGPMLGGFLLILPGFITDFIGAVLFVAPARRWAGARIARSFTENRTRREPSVIDLAPEEYRQLTDETPDGRGKKGSRGRRKATGS